jgi:hypothetical protein
MKTFEYKDMVIGFTTAFTLMWNDKSSGGSMDGAYYRPKVPVEMQGFFPVGDLAVKGYGDINNKSVIAVVKDAKGETGTALKPPNDYSLVWKDSGSGASMDGSMWRPVPPDGYVALGLVCNKGYGKPSTDAVRCVRSDLIIPAYPGDLIWDDRKTGSAKDFGSWRIDPPSAPAGEIYLSAGTFIGAASHTKPAKDPNAYALRLIFQQEFPDNPTPPAPRLRGYSKPSLFEEETVSYTSVLPWFTVRDPTYDPVAQLVKSPYYSLERTDRYKLIDFGYNTTSAHQKFTWSFTSGVYGEEAKTFSSTTSIELGSEWQVSGVFKLSAKLSQSFTHSETSTEGWNKSSTKTIDANVPPGKAVAVYTIQSIYRIFRADGTQVVNKGVGFDSGDSLYWTEYPITNDHAEITEKEEKTNFISLLLLLLQKLIQLFTRNKK